MSETTTSALRRRTSCAYCGERIAGTLWSAGGWDYPYRFGSLDRLRLRRAARVACRRHLDLPAVDDYYRS